MKNLAAELADNDDLPEEAGRGDADRSGGCNRQAPEEGQPLRISGLGILQVRKRPARMGRNPATGEAIKIKASKKVAFASRRTSRRRFDRQQADGNARVDTGLGALRVMLEGLELGGGFARK